MIPVAGSAYTYSYATMGELVAWIIGWDLILEYRVGAATVSVGWSGYVVRSSATSSASPCRRPGPTAPLCTTSAAGKASSTTGAILNLPAVFIIVVVTMHPGRRHQGVGALQRRHRRRQGDGRPARSSSSAPSSSPRELAPLHPRQHRRLRALRLFAASCAAPRSSSSPTSASTPSRPPAQEAKNPQRDCPSASSARSPSARCSTSLVPLVLTGVVPYNELAVPHPIAVGIDGHRDQLARARHRDRRHRRPVVGDAGAC